MAWESGVQDQFSSVFPALVTAVTLSGGTYYYTYSERVATGTGYAALEDGRSGSGVATGCVELNNYSLTPGAGFIAWLRLRSVPGDGALYEFQAPAPAVPLTITGIDNHVVRMDGTTAIQSSAAIIDDVGNLSLPTTTVGNASKIEAKPLDTLLSTGTGPHIVLTPNLGAAWEVAVVPAASLGGISNLKIGSSSSTLEMFTDTGPSSRLDFKTAGSYDFSKFSTGNVSANGIWASGVHGDIGFWLHDTGPSSQRSVAISGTTNGDMQLRVAMSGGGAAHAVLIDEFGASNPTYSVYHTGVQYDGVTGTVLPNAVVRGGILTSLGSGSYGTVTSVGITPPAAGITVSGSPVTTSGNMTLALADDLAALEAMSGTGFVTRTASNTYAQRTFTGTSNKLDVTNGDGISGNPTFTISSTYAGQTSIITLGAITTGTWDDGTW